MTTQQSKARSLAAGAYMSQDDVDFWESMLESENAEHTAAHKAALAAEARTVGANPFGPQRPSRRNNSRSSGSGSGGGGVGGGGVGGMGGSSSTSRRWQRPFTTPRAGVVGSNVVRAHGHSNVPRVSARSGRVRPSQLSVARQRALAEAQRLIERRAERPPGNAPTAATTASPASARAAATPPPTTPDRTHANSGGRVGAAAAAAAAAAGAAAGTAAGSPASRARRLSLGGIIRALEDDPRTLAGQTRFPMPATTPATAPTTRASQRAAERLRLTTVYNPLCPAADDPITAEGVRLGVVADGPGRLWREQLMRIGRWCHDTGNVVEGVGELDERERVRLDILFRRKPVRARVPLKGGRGRRCTRAYWASRNKIRSQDVQRRRGLRGPGPGPATYEPPSASRVNPDFGGVETPTPTAKRARPTGQPQSGAQTSPSAASQSQTPPRQASQRPAVQGRRVPQRIMRRPGPSKGPRPTVNGWVDDSKPQATLEELIAAQKALTRDARNQTYSGGPIIFGSPRTGTGPSSSTAAAPSGRRQQAPVQQQRDPNARAKGKGKAKADDVHAPVPVPPPTGAEFNRGIVNKNKGKGKGKASEADDDLLEALPAPVPGSPVLTASATGGIYLTPEEIIQYGGGAPNANTHPDGDPNRPQTPEVTPFDFPIVEGDSDIDGDPTVDFLEEEEEEEEEEEQEEEGEEEDYGENYNDNMPLSAWSSHESQASGFSGEEGADLGGSLPAGFNAPPYIGEHVFRTSADVQQSPASAAPAATASGSSGAVAAGAARAAKSGGEKKAVRWAALPKSNALGRSGLTTRSGKRYAAKTQSGRHSL